MEEEKVGDGVEVEREESGDGKNDLGFYKELGCSNCPLPRILLEKKEK